MYEDGNDGLAAQQEPMEEAAAAVKATATATRNKNRFMVLHKIREMSAVAAKCRESPWGTSTHQAEEKETLKVWNKGLLPFKDVFLKSWDTVSIAMGRGLKGAHRTLRKGMASWWRDR